MKILFLLLKITAGVIGALLGIRFIFRLLGASAVESSFVNWIYTNSDAFVAPFRGILPNLNFGDKFVLEFSTLVAIAIYIVAAYLIEMLLGYVEDAVKR
jgi:uncharacterized protein YggT (Ycf19 family)